MRPLPSPLHALATFASLALLAFVTGCGENQLEGDGARYPATGLSDETPVQGSASLEANPPAPPGEYDGVSFSGEGQGGMTPASAGEGDMVGNTEGYAETDPSALTEFRSTLDPYGQWVEDPSYGTVWVPAGTVVGSDFTPYVSAGHWTYDDEWVWASDYDWGWAPFHYGRWVYIGGRGWSWIPGRVYSGAWVSWRTGYDGYDYIGWAPLGPSWYWRNGFAVGLYGAPYAPYSYCHTHEIFAPTLHEHLVVGADATVVANHTRPYVAASPSVSGAGRVAARPVVASNGPIPGSLGLREGDIAHPTSAQEGGLLKARSLARPETAIAAGARPPVGYSRAPSALANQGGPRGQRAYGPVEGGRMPSQGYASPSMPSRSLPPYRSSPSFRSSAPAMTSPAYRSSPSMSSPSFHSSPSFSSPSFHSAPSFHSSPSAPSFHSSPAPSFHPSTSTHSFGGGGGHSGGGRGHR